MGEAAGEVRAHREEVERWRANRIARLTGPGGWLSIVGLEWLGGGPNTVGSDPTSDVVLPKGPLRVGAIEVREGHAAFVAEPRSGVTLNGAPVAGDPVPLLDDGDDRATVLRLGSLTFHVIRRGGALGVRVRDAESHARSAFAGIEHYPVDLRWRIESRFEPYDPARSAPVSTVLGTTETYAVPGAAVFEVAGRPLRLDAFLEHPDDDLFFVFADLTNHGETFGGGRYLYTPPADVDGIVVLDFNRAYNPPCVFTPHATCPLPLPGNRLPIRVEAGEKRYSGSTSKAAGAP